ncbi:DUF1501 domain-containing protein (plasmid) [Saccharobesus litoralis]|uniref:DUF1501 domain-containing protein n=1 Tax=Saccharobesus litoralis TaxID=2172099 RepID=A0A2S0VY92_9ALTE|nr:DUF1501 domain-containing protein [Saccharobesus litoralis]AWB69189.1 DUF1501 domain-containing protein [Saccharobesus litoralis]
MNKNRRSFIKNSSLGLGAAATSSLLTGGGLPGMSAAYASELADPLAPKKPHYPGKVKSVIWLHQNGAPSSMDLFDRKPMLEKMAGQTIPPSFLEGLTVATKGGLGTLWVDKNRTWKQYGESGAWFSDLLPNLAQHADDMTFIKSSKTIGATHNISIIKLNTGELTPGRPSLGAWVSYALGSGNPDLPSYIVMYNRSQPRGGPVNWSSGFLPAAYQGTTFLSGSSPILFLDRPDLVSATQQKNSLALLRDLDIKGLAQRHSDSELQARIRSYELAERMQYAAPEAVDLSKESEATKEMYGLNDPTSKGYGNLLLRARRLVERGVKFIHIVSGSPEGETKVVDWDAHANLPRNHGIMAKMVDKPIAGLLTDLKARGLLDTTLVVWASEFGRTPWGESGNGRDHNPWGYTQWMAGGGLKKGFSYGETDELGLKVADPSFAVDTYDVHATVLHLLGLDHLRTTYVHNGRAERPTVNFGKIVTDILA